MATGIDMGTYILQYTLFMVEVLPKKKVYVSLKILVVYSIHNYAET